MPSRTRSAADGFSSAGIPSPTEPIRGVRSGRERVFETRSSLEEDFVVVDMSGAIERKKRSDIATDDDDEMVMVMKYPMCDDYGIGTHVS
jgi:hypothetical protein